MAHVFPFYPQSKCVTPKARICHPSAHSSIGRGSSLPLTLLYHFGGNTEHWFRNNSKCVIYYFSLKNVYLAWATKIITLCLAGPLSLTKGPLGENPVQIRFLEQNIRSVCARAKRVSSQVGRIKVNIGWMDPPKDKWLHTWKERQ